MLSYIKSFLYNTVEKKESKEEPVYETKTIKRNLSLREKIMFIRHRLNNNLNNHGLRWNLAGWSSKLNPHTDWTIKIKNVTLPIIRTKSNITRYISAKNIPISDESGIIPLQKYLENFGQFNPNIKINYHLASNYNESIQFKCSVVIIPKNTNTTLITCKLTHQYKQLTKKRILLVSTKNGSLSFIQTERKHDIHIADTTKETNKDGYNICLEIPIIKSPLISDLFIRDENKPIIGNLVYYLYLDENNITSADAETIGQIFDNFKNQKYAFKTI